MTSRCFVHEPWMPCVWRLDCYLGTDVHNDKTGSVVEFHQSPRWERAVDLHLTERGKMRVDKRILCPGRCRIAGGSMCWLGVGTLLLERDSFHLGQTGGPRLLPPRYWVAKKINSHASLMDPELNTDSTVSHLCLYRHSQSMDQRPGRGGKIHPPRSHYSHHSGRHTSESSKLKEK